MVQSNKVLSFAFWLCALILFNHVSNQWLPGGNTPAKVALFLIYLTNAGFMVYYMVKKPQCASEETLNLVSRLGVIIITSQLPILME